MVKLKLKYFNCYCAAGILLLKSICKNKIKQNNLVLKKQTKHPDTTKIQYTTF